MNPDSRFFKLLGLIGTITGILGFAGQIGIAPIRPLVTAVEIPVWVLLSIPLVIIWLVSEAVFRAVQPLSTKLHDTTTALAESRSQKAQLESTKAELENKLRNVPSYAAELKEAAEVRARLAEYERLEHEIMGLLRSGSRMSLTELRNGTSAGSHSDGSQRLTRAIAALGDQIEGDGWGYRLASRVNPTRP